MEEGDIALAPIPQADGRIKNRPVIILRELPPYNDLLVCGVSSQLQQYVQNFDEFISPSDPDFNESSLKVASVVRLGFLAVLPRNSIAGSMGKISPQRHKRLLKTLSDYLLEKVNEHEPLRPKR